MSHLKDAVSHIVIMQMFVLVMIIDRWASEE